MHKMTIVAPKVNFLNFLKFFSPTNDYSTSLAFEHNKEVGFTFHHQQVTAEGQVDLNN